MKFWGELVLLLNRVWELFSRSPSKKIEKDKEDIRKENDEFKDTGRPSW